MPTMADIIVKKANGTTDVTYTAKSPSAGNGVPAIWANDAYGTNAASHSELRMTTSETGDGKSRKARLTYNYPIWATNSTTGLVSVVDSIPIAVDIKLPKGVLDADISEAIAQGTNLLVSTLIRAALNARYAPT